MSEILDLIRSVAEDQSDLDLDDLARQVAEQTPPELLLQFYTYALRQLVADVIRYDRKASLDRALKDRASPPSNDSPKLRERRNWWAEMLASPVHLGNSLYKVLGDCTVDDLQFCVDERLSNVARINGQINNYKRLIQMLVKEGVRTVADLPPQQKWEIAA